MGNAGTGQALIATLQRVLPSLTSEQLLLLQFVDVTESQELPLVFFSTAFLLEVWNRRVKKGRITLYEIRTTLEAKCSLKCPSFTLKYTTMYFNYPNDNVHY